MSTKRKKPTRHMWTDAEREQLIMAFEAAPEDGRGQWLKSQGANPGWFYRMRREYIAAHPELNFTEPAKPTVALQRIEKHPAKQSAKQSISTSPAALVAEYEKLERGEKGLWLDAHGISRQHIYDLRNRLARTNGHLPTVRESRVQAPPSPATVIEATFTASPSLDDAILALEVKRDHYSEIINNLKAMRGSR